MTGSNETWPKGIKCCVHGCNNWSDAGTMAGMHPPVCIPCYELLTKGREKLGPSRGVTFIHDMWRECIGQQHNAKLTNTSKFKPGDYVIVDGDPGRAMTVTCVAFRAADVLLEISYFHNGESKVCWVEQYRCANASVTGVASMRSFP